MHRLISLWNTIQSTLFPWLEEELDPLTEKQKHFVSNSRTSSLFRIISRSVIKISETTSFGNKMRNIRMFACHPMTRIGRLIFIIRAPRAKLSLCLSENKQAPMNTCISFLI